MLLPEKTVHDFQQPIHGGIKGRLFRIIMDLLCLFLHGMAVDHGDVFHADGGGNFSQLPLVGFRLFPPIFINDQDIGILLTD